jgi:hypothetical protein
MINSIPNNEKYHQGNYVPKNKEKVLKLNNLGGIFFRSSWEAKIMKWLDYNDKIIRWGAECLRIPYEIKELINGVLQIKTHSYYPDFYYELKLSDNSLKKVVAEVKPKNEYNDAVLFTEGKFEVPEKISSKKLKSLEYRFKMAQRNAEKWKTMINWCNLKGYDFIIITEDHLKKFNL